MKRTNDYAHNRIVCGVHYPSDIEAGRNIAYMMFGSCWPTRTFRESFPPHVKKPVPVSAFLRSPLPNNPIVPDNPN